MVTFGVRTAPPKGFALFVHAFDVMAVLAFWTMDFLLRPYFFARVEGADVMTLRKIRTANKHTVLAFFDRQVASALRTCRAHHDFDCTVFMLLWVVDVITLGVIRATDKRGAFAKLDGQCRLTLWTIAVGLAYCCGRGRRKKRRIDFAQWVLCLLMHGTFGHVE
jgi:hypothetical protein